MQKFLDKHLSETVSMTERGRVNGSEESEGGGSTDKNESCSQQCRGKQLRDFGVRLWL